MAQILLNLADFVSTVIRNYGDNGEKSDDASLVYEEIGDGNHTHVTRVKSAHLSLLLKHPSKGSGSHQVLSCQSLELEYKALTDMQRFCPGSGPIPYEYSPEKNILLIEDMPGYAVLRHEIRASHVDEVATQRVAEHIGTIHNATYVTNLPKKEFDELYQKYSENPLMSLMQTQIFEGPFDNANTENIVFPEVRALADQRIYGNQEVLAEVSRFKQLFLNKKECLLHGNLHTGSIMVKDGAAKIVNPEYAFMGPAAFDLGMLLANYIIAYYSHMLTPQDNDAHRRVSYKMLDICHKTEQSYFSKFNPNVPDHEQFLGDFVSEVTGFCAIEILRRMLGTAHVEDTAGSGSTELEIVQSALRLLRASHRIRTVDRLLVIGLMLTF